MNKTELIAAVAEKTGMSKKDTEAVITATLASITEALQNDDKVQLVGFGSFEVKMAWLSRHRFLFRVRRILETMCLFPAFRE